MAIGRQESLWQKVYKIDSIFNIPLTRIYNPIEQLSSVAQTKCWKVFVRVLIQQDIRIGCHHRVASISHRECPETGAYWAPRTPRVSGAMTEIWVSLGFYFALFFNISPYFKPFYAFLWLFTIKIWVDKLVQYAPVLKGGFLSRY